MTLRKLPKAPQIPVSRHLLEDRLKASRTSLAVIGNRVARWVVAIPPQFPAGLTGQDTKVSTQRTHLGPPLNCTLNPSNNPRSLSESATLGTPPRPVNQLHCPAFAPLCLRGKKNFKAADSRNLFQRKARKQAAGSIHPVGIISTNAPAFTPALKSLEC